MNKSEIHFFNEELNFVLPHKRKTREWVSEIIHRENKLTGAINFIFCTDKYLHNLNLQFLNHDTLTDIITFDQSQNKSMISGDIFISLERVRENARTYKSGFTSELSRVMCHGILHLIGYDDKTTKESKAIRSKEDYYLSLRPNFIR